MALNSMINYFN